MARKGRGRKGGKTAMASPFEHVIAKGRGRKGGKRR